MSSLSYVYFPGCSLKDTGRAYEKSLLVLFELLGIRLEELPDWNCCGATSYMSINEEAAFVLAARNLALAKEREHRDFVAPCSACYLVHRKTQDYVSRYPILANRVEKSLKRAGLPSLNGTSLKIRHPLEILYTDVGLEQIRSRAARSWSGGPIACYYGCQAVRPYGEVDRVDNPMRMEELLEACGVGTVVFSLKTKCCGGSLTGTIHSVGLRLNQILLKEALRRGAQAIVTICPLCQFNLDAHQSEMNSSAKENFDMPIFYLTQVLGWALGGEIKALGLEHCISGRSLIKKWFFEGAGCPR